MARREELERGRPGAGRERGASLPSEAREAVVLERGRPGKGRSERGASLPSEAREAVVLDRWALDRRRFLEGALHTVAVGSLFTGCVPDGGQTPLPRGKDAGFADAEDRLPSDAGHPDAEVQLDAGHVDAGHVDAGAAEDASAPDAGPSCDDPFAGGTMLGLVPFVSEGSSPIEQRTGVGWDARYYTDLSTITASNSVIENDRFYVRTEYPDRLDPTAPWRIAVRGLVSSETSLSIDDLTPNVRPMGAHVLECSGNHRGGGFGLLSAAQWSGVPLAEVLADLSVGPSATRVLVSGFDDHSTPSVNGHSTPGASWIFSFAELASTGAFLATEMNGQVLPRDHGFPVRLVVPGWYGCACIKWVDDLVLVDESAASTSQMREFASRTHQNGVPTLARNFRPAAIHQAAMPTRIERWNVGGAISYRVSGIMWGGSAPTDALEIRFGSGSWQRVEVCPRQFMNETWTLWSHRWAPTQTGRYSIRMRITDPNIPTQRLDTDFYLREVTI